MWSSGSLLSPLLRALHRPCGASEQLQARAPHIPPTESRFSSVQRVLRALGPPPAPHFVNQTPNSLLTPDSFPPGGAPGVSGEVRGPDRS